MVEYSFRRGNEYGNDALGRVVRVPRWGVSKRSDDDNAGLKVVILSGPSGSGKSTVVNRLLASSPVALHKAVSATTRPPRAGELDGVDYYFLTPAEFENKRAGSEFVECAEVHGAGYWYGTLKSELEAARRRGAWALLEIDVEGATRVMDAYPQAVSIFLTTFSEQEYEKRLRSRGTETEGGIKRRLQTARRELQQAAKYQYHVTNDDLDKAVREIAKILSSRETE